MFITFWFASGFFLVLFSGAILLSNYLKKNPVKFSHVQFFFMMSSFVIGAIFESVVSNSSHFITVFTVFAVLGVIGETIFSIWWNIFYKKSFWKYTVKGMLNGYTSYLNFIAWGVGGILCLTIFKTAYTFDKGMLLAAENSFYELVVSFLGVVAVQQILLRIFTRERFTKVTILNYLFWIIPTIVVVAVLSVKYINLLPVLVITGLTAFVFEYLYGKILFVLFGEKFWVYHHVSFDNNHSTLLNIVPFIHAAVFFTATYSTFFI